MRSWHLFATAVLIWGTTWHAILYQLNQTSAAFGVAVRFTLAGVLALAWSLVRGQSLRMPGHFHARIAFQGVFMYSVSYLCVYLAERHVPSGLVAVGYSANPLLLGLVGWLLWRTPLSRRLVAGGALGMVGVTLIFWPEITHARADAQTALGAAFTVAAVLLSAVGSLAASRNAATGVAFWPALGYGMLYGAACSWLFVWASGEPVHWPTVWSWWLALGYLALFGSVIAFAAYLALQQRVGAAPASTIGAATPLVALAVSAALEGYRPGWMGLTGIALTVVGNALALGLWPSTGPQKLPMPRPAE